MSYFNAASHGLPAPHVYEAMINFMKAQAKSTSAPITLTCDEELFNAKKAIASVISARVEQLGFASTTTDAWHAVSGSLDLAGKRILVTEHEWGDYYRLLAKRDDIEVQVLPSLDFAKPDLSSWEQLIDDDVAAIFVPLVTSIAGYRYPVEDIGALPRSINTKLIVDAAQALGQTEVNVSHLNCDAIISTCRKWMRGPRQTALFWINDTWGNQDQPITASALAPADQNQALIVGAGAAAQSILQHSIHQIERQLSIQANEIRTWAAATGIRVYGGENAKSAIVSLVLGQTELKAVNDALARVGIVGKVVDIHTAEPLAQNPNDPQKLLRLSAHVYNSNSELEQLENVISRAVHVI